MTLISPRYRSSVFFAGCLLAALVATRLVPAQTRDAVQVKKQLPADERAFKAARATTDPEKRLAAMRSFVHDYPRSATRVSRAQISILTVLLDSFPDRVAEIDSQAKLLIKGSGKGESRDREEVYIAFLLAEAGKSGVDLPYAEKIAKDAVNHANEPDFEKNYKKMLAKYKMPPPKSAAIHSEFANTRAEALAVLADVYLREGKQLQASALVTEAYGLDPLVDDVNSQRGRLALLDHNDALALESFERAELVGAVSAADREKTVQLYRQAHGGSDAGLNAEMDELYGKLFPAPFTPGKPAQTAAGHTALLELFTGSACEPCVGGDLAVEGLLDAYPRSEIVALAFDQHIPEPDPLSNPDSIARAELYDINGTPSFVLDGATQPFYGADRTGSKNLYDKLAKQVDAEAALSTGVQLKLTASEGAGGLVAAQAVVTVPSSAEVAKSLAPRPKAAPIGTPAKDNKKPPVATAPPIASPAAAPIVPHLLVNFALVEDDIRYSGENGIRFHRMVVRSLAKPADSGFSVEPAATATLDASFDPAAISRSLATYLDGFEQNNDRFGKIKFLTKDTTIHPNHLAVVAWVQDSVTHRVLQAAMVPLSAPADASQKGGR